MWCMQKHYFVSRISNRGESMYLSSTKLTISALDIALSNLEGSFGWILVDNLIWNYKDKELVAYRSSKVTKQHQNWTK